MTFLRSLLLSRLSKRFANGPWNCSKGSFNLLSDKLWFSLSISLTYSLSRARVTIRPFQQQTCLSNPTHQCPFGMLQLCTYLLGTHYLFITNGIVVCKKTSDIVYSLICQSLNEGIRIWWRAPCLLKELHGHWPFTTTYNEWYLEKFNKSNW